MTTTAEIVDMLRQRCEATSQVSVAREAGVSEAHVSRVLAGKQKICPKLAGVVGYHRVARWEPLHRAGSEA